MSKFIFLVPEGTLYSWERQKEENSGRERIVARLERIKLWHKILKCRLCWEKWKVSSSLHLNPNPLQCQEIRNLNCHKKYNGFYRKPIPLIEERHARCQFLQRGVVLEGQNVDKGKFWCEENITTSKNAFLSWIKIKLYHHLCPPYLEKQFHVPKWISWDIR